MEHGSNADRTRIKQCSIRVNPWLLFPAVRGEKPPEYASGGFLGGRLLAWLKS